MSKLLVFLLCLLFFPPDKKKSYFIVAGDITCKACVIQLQHYLEKQVKKEQLSIAMRDKGNFIMNESGLSYYKSELPEATFVFFKEHFFPKKEKYPYLLIVYKRDTLTLPYDSLFVGENLNVRVLK